MDNPFHYRDYKDIKKILVIRSARMWQFTQALTFLKDEYKEATVSVLTQTGNRDEIEKYKEVDDILLFAKDRFTWFNFDLRLIKETRKRTFDLIVVLHNNEEGVTYVQLDFIVLLCGARYVIAYDKAHQCREITIIYWIASLFTRVVWLNFLIKYSVKLCDLTLFIFHLLLFTPLGLIYCLFKKMGSWRKYFFVKGK
ncbi:MAG: hypothetical protein V1872_03225 [bacterium]